MWSAVLVSHHFSAAKTKKVTKATKARKATKKTKKTGKTKKKKKPKKPMKPKKPKKMKIYRPRDTLIPHCVTLWPNCVKRDTSGSTDSASCRLVSRTRDGKSCTRSICTDIARSVWCSQAASSALCR